jgi:hypothetical protein
MIRLVTIRASVAALVLSLSILAPLAAQAQVSVGIGITIGQPPPPVPIYYQPYPPAPDYIWSPGYWAWGPGGYFWVPGTWVFAPQPGLYWTPGYWGWNGYGYFWNPGYWAPQVGFYGGINYGYGYFGNGYDGGVWSGNRFEYNTYVTRVNTTIIHNVYVNRNVYVNNSTTRISYVGGHGGLQTRATAEQLAIAHGRHYGMTSVQQEHVRVAEQNRGYLASVNHGKPSDPAFARPLSQSNRPSHFTPVTAQDRATAEAHIVRSHGASSGHAPAAAPAHHAAPSTEHHAAPAAAPEHHAAPSTEHHPSVQYYENAPQHEVQHAPASAHHAPSYTAPTHTQQMYHAPPQHAAPQHAAPQHAAPQHAAPQHAAPAHEQPHPRSTARP